MRIRLLLLFLIILLIYPVSATVKLWDSGVSSPNHYNFESTLAWDNKDNWYQVPYGTTSHTFTGDMIIENDAYYAFYRRQDGVDVRPPMIYGKVDGTSDRGDEVYAKWLHWTGSKWDHIWNTYRYINDAVTINENTADVANVTLVCNDYGNSNPGWNVVTYVARSESNNLEMIPRNDLEASPNQDHQYDFALHAANSWLSTTLPNTITSSDFVIDKNEYAYLDLYEQTTEYPPDTHGRIMLYQIYLSDKDMATIHTLTPNNFTTDFSASLSRRVNGLALETIRCYAQQGTSVDRVFLGVIDHRPAYIGDTVNQAMSTSEIYTSTEWIIGGTGSRGTIPHGVWRVTGRFDVGGTDTFYTHYQESGGINFTAPEAGTLEVLSAYLYDNNSNTPAGTTTILDIYEDATNYSYSAPPSLPSNPDESFSNIIKESQPTFCAQSYDSGSSDCLHYTTLILGNTSYAKTYRSLLDYNDTYSGTLTNATVPFTLYFSSSGRVNDSLVEVYAVSSDFYTSYTNWNNNSSSTTWNNPGADWIDKDGTPNGNVPYDSFNVPHDAAIGTTYTANVTDLVNDYNTSVKMLLKLNNTNESQLNNMIYFYSFGSADPSHLPIINITPGTTAPNITSWANNFTNNNSLTISVNKTCTVQYNITCSDYTEAYWFIDDERQIAYTGNTFDLTNYSANYYNVSVYTIKTSPENISNQILWEVTATPFSNYNYPADVTNLTALANNTNIVLDWDVGIGGNTTDWYIVQDIDNEIELYNGTNTTCNHTGLDSRTTINYYVQAVNSTDGELAYSDYAYINNETRYDHVANQTDLFYNLTGLSAGANFTIKVRAYDSVHGVYSDWTEQTVCLGVPDTIFEYYNGTGWQEGESEYYLWFECFWITAEYPDGVAPNAEQSDSQHTLRITNNGTATGIPMMKFNESTPAEVTVYVDDDYTVAGAVSINDTYQAVGSSLAAGHSVNLSAWVNLTGLTSIWEYEVYADVQ